MSEDLGHGLIREWLEDKRIMILKMPKGAGREAINLWYETTIAAAENWDKSTPFLVLHDNRELGFSSNFRDKAVELGAHSPEGLSGRAAVLLGSGIMGNLLSIVAQVSGRRVKQDLELKIFTDYDKAVEWLKELL